MLPNTLLTRLFLLLASLMAISALAWTTIISLSEQGPRARQVAQLLTSVANLTRAAVIAAAPERRRSLLNELSRQEGIRIAVAEDGEPAPGQPPDDPFLSRVVEQLRDTLGPDTQLLVDREGEQALFLRIDIEGDDYWIVLPRERFNRSRSFQWLGWGLLAALIALVTAGLWVSRLTRPLRKLADAAREIGAGRTPEPMPTNGPDELATVAQAFNQMSADLARLDQDRALILAGISHDLRTPLTRLRMGIEMTASEEALRSGMLADVDEMDGTIGQFLDFARADSGEAVAETDLVALLDDLATQYRKRGILIETLVTPVGIAKVRPKMLRRAISNLIDNAQRHGDATKTITLGLDQIDAAIIIEVSDLGPGIPPEEVERLKRPFTRLESSRGNPSGAGLGLAIVERVARQHGGRLLLSPRQGGGLTARLVIPRA
jgi:two-component system, OmpR family, osmolarity sensor histidine kinase EnvZ